MKKENFIELIASLTPQQLNELIAQKGKEPKLIKPVVFIKK